MTTPSSGMKIGLHHRHAGPRSALPLWLTAGLVTVVGTLATTSALPVAVFRATGDPVAVSALAAIQAVPYLVLGLLVGRFADRVDRQRLMVVGLTISASVAGVQALGLVGGVRLPLVYTCAVLLAVLFVVTDAAEFGLLPDVVPAEDVPRAWGWGNSLTNAFDVVVPPVATAAVALVGPAPVVAVDAASFLLAALLITRLVPLPRAPEGEGEWPPPTVPTGSDDARAGLRFIWHHPTLRPLVLTGLFNSAAFGLVTALAVVFAVRGLGVPSAGPQVGLVLAAIAAGGVVSGYLFHRLYAARRVRLLTLIGTTGCAAAVLLVTRTGSVVFAVVLLAGYGGLLALTVMTGIVYRQTVAPDHLRSRVMVVGRMIAWGGQPLGAAAGGLLAQAAGVRSAYLLAAGLFAIAALVATTVRVPDAGGLSAVVAPDTVTG